MLKKVKDKWRLIDYTKFSTLPRKFGKTKKHREQLIEFYRSVIKSQVRDDYREAAELSLMLLGSNDKFNFRKPAGDSNARWMSKILYASKAYMFADQFGFDDVFVSALEKFLFFSIFAYLPAWFRAPFITEAAISDIQFAKEMNW